MDKEQEKLKRAAAYKKRVAAERAIEKKIAAAAVAKHRAKKLANKMKKVEGDKVLRARIKAGQQERVAAGNPTDTVYPTSGGIAEALRAALKRRQEEQV